MRKFRASQQPLSDVQCKTFSLILTGYCCCWCHGSENLVKCILLNTVMKCDNLHIFATFFPLHTNLSSNIYSNTTTRMWKYSKKKKVETAETTIHCENVVLLSYWCRIGVWHTHVFFFIIEFFFIKNVAETWKMKRMSNKMFCDFHFIFHLQFFCILVFFNTEVGIDK